MRIKLGPTAREKRNLMDGWSLWFAWYPVRLAWLDGRRNREGAWLEWVARRNNKDDGSIYLSGSRFEYRPPEETLLVPQKKIA